MFKKSVIIIAVLIFLAGVYYAMNIETDDRMERFVETSEQIKPLLKENFNLCRELFWQTDVDKATDCYYKALDWNVLVEPYYPNELFYVFRKSDSTYISQSRREHFKANSLLSDDIATGGQRLNIYAPDFHNEIKEYKIETLPLEGKGEAIRLHADNFYFELGHAKLKITSDTVKTGEFLGQVLCPGDENSGMTTGCHIDFSFWVSDGKTYGQQVYITNPDYNINEEIDKKIKADTEHTTKGQIYFTTYNAEVGQTDNAPCSGRHGDVCELYKQGKNPIALSRDLIQGQGEADFSNGYCKTNCPYIYGEKVIVSPVNNWQKPYVAVIVDTMNIRHKNRGDQFSPSKSMNNSYWATITKINY